MDTGYYKFYENKFKIFLLFLGSIAFVALCFWMRNSDDADMVERLAGGIGIIFFGLGVIIFLFKLLANKVYLEITPTYIKIGNSEKLLWTDITCAKEFCMNIKGSQQHWWGFEVKDIEKYNLTFTQKININWGYPPFCISLALLAQKDRQLVKHILQEHISDCKFDLKVDL